MQVFFASICGSKALKMPDNVLCLWRFPGFVRSCDSFNAIPKHATSRWSSTSWPHCVYGCLQQELGEIKCETNKYSSGICSLNLRSQTSLWQPVQIGCASMPMCIFNPFHSAGFETFQKREANSILRERNGLKLGKNLNLTQREKH